MLASSGLGSTLNGWLTKPQSLRRIKGYACTQFLETSTRQLQKMISFTTYRCSSWKHYWTPSPLVYGRVCWIQSYQNRWGWHGKDYFHQPLGTQLPHCDAVKVENAGATY